MAKETKDRITIVGNIVTMILTFLTVMYFGANIQNSVAGIKTEVIEYVDTKFLSRDVETKIMKNSICENKDNIKHNSEKINNNDKELYYIKKTIKK